eukprot:1182239-Prymnesium_polylepis.3
MVQVWCEQSHAVWGLLGMGALGMVVVCNITELPSRTEGACHRGVNDDAVSPTLLPGGMQERVRDILSPHMPLPPPSLPIANQTSPPRPPHMPQPPPSPSPIKPSLPPSLPKQALLEWGSPSNSSHINVSSLPYPLNPKCPPFPPFPLPYPPYPPSAEMHLK